MNDAQIPALVVGEVVRTTNAAESDPSSAQIPGLWARVLGDSTLAGWPRRVGTDVFSVYFDYESDETGAYSVLVGVGADSDTDVPAGSSSVRLDETPRVAFPSAGPLPAGIIDAWGRVWSATASGEIDRAFTTDVEVHRADGPAEILVAVRASSPTSARSDTME